MLNCREKKHSFILATLACTHIVPRRFCLDGVFCCQGNAAEGNDDEDDHLEVAQVDDVVEETPDPANDRSTWRNAAGAPQQYVQHGGRRTAFNNKDIFRILITTTIRKYKPGLTALISSLQQFCGEIYDKAFNISVLLLLQSRDVHLLSQEHYQKKEIKSECLKDKLHALQTYSLWTDRKKSCEFKTSFKILLISNNPFEIDMF